MPRSTFTKHLPKGGLKIAINLALNNVKDRNETQIWFKRTTVGVNKLYAIMKTMAVKANLTNKESRPFS